MTFALDFRTLSLATWFLSFLFAIGLFLFARSQREPRGLFLVSGGFAAIGLGYVLLGLRGAIEPFASIVVANAVIYAGHCGVVFGLFRLIGVAQLRRGVFALSTGGALIVALTAFTFVDYDVNARIIAYSSAAVVICVIAGQGFAVAPRAFGRLSLNALTGLFIVFSAYHVFRVIWTLRSEQLMSFMDSSWVHGVSVIQAELMVLSTAFAALWIVTDSLQHELRDMARTDPLTKTLNRRAFEEACDREAARSRRTGAPYGLIMCDIDHFKRFNDRYGHAGGDTALKRFATVLRGALRAQDVVARYGGEEFVAILPDTSGVAALAAAEKLRAAVAADVIPLEDGVEAALTASFGVAEAAGGQDWRARLDAADAALYHAKNDGRNRVARAA